MSALTVRRCATLNEAHIVCGLLRSHGFEATVEEANHAANGLQAARRAAMQGHVD